MDILVTGGTGVVGWEILSRAPENVDMSYTYIHNQVEHPAAEGHELDIRDSAAVRKLVMAINPDVIIHSAALTDVDYCESHPESAHAVNVEGTANVIDAAEAVDAHLVFLSTSFVFDGSEHPHRIDDIRNPVNVYGRTKAEAEKLVESAPLPTSIVRTDQPYGWTESWQNQTMVEWTLDQISKEEPVAVFDDWYNVPTFLPDLADAIVEISRTEAKGLFHVVGPDYISRYDWACEIATILDGGSTMINSTSSTDFQFEAERPNVYIKKSTTSCLSLQDMDPITESMRTMK